MSKLVPIIAGVTGTTIIGAGGSYLLLTQNTTKIKDTFKEALIDFTKDTTLITTKLTKLKGVTENPKHTKLISAKTKENSGSGQGLEDFKNACNEIYNSTFSKKDSDLFKDFQSYCSKNIKDVVTDANWFTGTINWKERFDKIKQGSTKPVSAKLTTIVTGNSEQGNELQKWCEDIATEIFGGESSPEFKDAKIFCGRNNWWT